MGEAIELTDPEHIRRVEVIRRDLFGGRSNQPLKHLGEAQTCFLIHEVEEWQASTWISDDRDALDFARFQNIPTMETMELRRADGTSRFRAPGSAAYPTRDLLDAEARRGLGGCRGDQPLGASSEVDAVADVVDAVGHPADEACSGQSGESLLDPVEALGGNPIGGLITIGQCGRPSDA